MIKRPTIILLALFAISIGAFFYLDKNPIKSQGTPTPTLLPGIFTDLKFENIIAIRYLGKNSETFQVELSDKQWTLTSENNMPIEWSVVEDIVATLIDLQAQNKIATPPSETLLGFLITSPRIELKQNNNVSLTLTVGGLTPTSNGYYVKTSESVYVVDKYELDTLLEKFTRSSITGTPEPTSTPTPLPSSTPTLPPKS